VSVAGSTILFRLRVDYLEAIDIFRCIIFTFILKYTNIQDLKIY